MFEVGRDIDSEHGDGGASGRRESVTLDTDPCEVLGPAIPARVEKGRDGAGFRVENGEVRPCARIAVMAGEGEIARLIAAAMQRSGSGLWPGECR